MYCIAHIIFRSIYTLSKTLIASTSDESSDWYFTGFLY